MRTRRLLAIAGLALSAASAQGAVKLSPQSAVDRALAQGSNAKIANLTAQRAYATLESARGAYDLQVGVTPSYQYDEAQTLSGLNNLIDRTAQVNAQISKQFATGTNLQLQYLSITQNSTLSSFAAASALRSPSESLDALSLQARQSLWRNPFGLADRLGIEAAEMQVAAQEQNRAESLENVALDVLTAYWNAYVAQRQLADSMDARKRYEDLVRSVTRKNAVGLAAPGEQPRLQAEFDQASARVKTAAATYLDAIDSLLTLMRTPMTDDVVFDVKDELPPVPRLAPKDLEQLRPMRAAKMSAEAAEMQRRAVFNRATPQLDVVLRGVSTGVEPTSDRSRAEMFGGQRPTYYVGLEFQTALDSATFRGQRADAAIAAQIAATQAEQTLDTTRDQLRASERDVNAKYEYARASHAAVLDRGAVVRQMESAYRQGRQPLVEVIRAYNDWFAARLDDAQSIGNYNVALNRLAAARDELFRDAR